jgi:hypothetical protein
MWLMKEKEFCKCFRVAKRYTMETYVRVEVKFHAFRNEQGSYCSADAR